METCICDPETKGRHRNCPWCRKPRKQENIVDQNPAGKDIKTAIAFPCEPNCNICGAE
jgi:hypothetical protein